MALKKHNGKKEHRKGRMMRRNKIKILILLII
jgi:hypothetical protein